MKSECKNRYVNYSKNATNKKVIMNRIKRNGFKKQMSSLLNIKIKSNMQNKNAKIL